MTGNPYYVCPPPWVYRFTTLLRCCYRLRYVAVLLLLAVLVSIADGAITTAPPATREATLCAALGTEAPCTYHEIGRLRGTLIFASNTDEDLVHTLLLLFTARGSSVASLQYNTSASETDVLERVQDPQTNWSHLVADRDAWPALRALARVTDGVPVIVAAAPRRGAVDHVGDPLASVAMLKVRVAIMQLVGVP